MKAKTFQIGLTILMLLFVGIGFVLFVTAFHYSVIPLLIYTTAGSIVFVVVRNLTQSKVKGVLGDERDATVSGKAASITLSAYIIAGNIALAVLLILYSLGRSDAGPAIAILGVSLSFIGAVFFIARVVVNRRT